MEITGTREWSTSTVNCCSGCSHDCRYCYARQMAIRFKRSTYDQWKNESIRQHDVERNYNKRKGRVMFPSTHDITPTNFDACFIVLEKLLYAGNDVLVVSKPHLECIESICNRLEEFKKQIIYRFTIGALNDAILSFWEPGAPAYAERRSALKHAFDHGFETSVSIEPMLDADHIKGLVDDLSPLVTHSIWIGQLNKIRGRVKIEDENVEEAVQAIEQGQTDDKIKLIYGMFKDNPLIRWKDSIKKVVGIEAPQEPGMDI
jgi:DNA repair photolyase